MFLARTFTTLGIVAALGITAQADQGRGRGSARGERGSASAERGDRRGPPAAPAPRVAPPRSAVPRGGPPVTVAPPRGGAGPIVTLPGATAQHRAGPYYPPPIYRGYRNYPAPRYYGPAPRYYRPHIRLARPYYSFRPRVSLGFGVWVGFPVPFPAWASVAPYPSAYPYPVPYPVPYPSPYPSPYPVPTGSAGYPAQAPAGSVTVAPGQPAYGGVSLEITPPDAELWVDGGYAGRAGDFGPQAQPLTLTVGVHHVEVRAPGYRPLAFDVTVSAGYVVPYQGVLQPGP